MTQLYTAGVDIEPLRLRRLRHVVGPYAYTVTVRAPRRVVEVQPVMSDLLTALGHPGDRGERRLLEAKIDRAVPFLATAPLHDVIVRNAQYLSVAAAEDLAVGCELAGKALTYIVEPPLTAALGTWLGNNTRSTTVTAMLERLGAGRPPWTPRRSVPAAASLVDLLDIAHDITGVAPLLPICHTCRQPVVADDVHGRLRKLAERCNSQCPSHAATSLEAAGLLSTADTLEWIRTLDDLHLRLSRYRDSLRPALVVLGKIARGQHGMALVDQIAAALYALTVDDVAPDGSSVRLLGRSTAVPADLRVYLQRQYLSVVLAGRRGHQAYCAFGVERVTKSAIPGLLRCV